MLFFSQNRCEHHQSPGEAMPSTSIGKSSFDARPRVRTHRKLGELRRRLAKRLATRPVRATFRPRREDPPPATRPGARPRLSSSSQRPLELPRLAQKRSNLRQRWRRFPLPPDRRANPAGRVAPGSTRSVASAPLRARLVARKCCHPARAPLEEGLGGHRLRRALRTRTRSA